MKLYKILLVITLLLSFYSWLYVSNNLYLKTYMSAPFATYDIYGNNTNNVNDFIPLYSKIIKNLASFAYLFSPILLLVTLFIGFVTFLKLKVFKVSVWQIIHVVVYFLISYFILYGTIINYFFFEK